MLFRFETLILISKHLIQKRVPNPFFVPKVQSILPVRGGTGTSRRLPWRYPHLESPPLTREQLNLNANSGRPVRITPAHAGTTTTAGKRFRGCRDHPPLTREQPAAKATAIPMSGITPAHAGTIPEWHPAFCRTRDHPRSRGNNGLKTDLPIRPLGSPPLTREQLEQARLFLFHLGITPAHAGTTPEYKNHAF